MEYETKKIPPAECLDKNSPRFEGIASDAQMIIPKEHIIDKVKDGFLYTIFCLTSIVFSAIVYPLFILTFMLLMVPRIIITLYTKVVHYHKNIKILSGLSSFWAAGQDMHVFVQIIQGECDLRKVQTHFETILLKKSLLKEVIFRKYGYFCSSVVDSIDIDEHVKYYSSKSQNFPIKEEEILFDLENKFSKENFNSDNDNITNHTNQQPSWEVLFIPKFLPKFNNSKCNDLNHFALVYRVSNSCLNLSDTINYLCHHTKDTFTEKDGDLPDDTDCSTNFSCIQYFSNTVGKIATFVSAIILGPMLFLRSTRLSTRDIHTDSISGEIQQNGKQAINCYFSKSELFNIEALNILKEGTRTSFISILLSSVGTSVRNLLLGQNYQCPDKLCCSYHSSYYCNCHSNCPGHSNSTITKFHLGIGFDFPIKRLRSALGQTDNKKNILVAAEGVANQFILKIIGCFPASTITQVYKSMHHTNVNIEHLVGPSQPFKMLRGDVVDIYGWSFPISPNLVELRAFLVSYRGNVRACYTGASKNISNSHIQTLKFEFKNEILKIAELCGLNRKALHQ